MLSAPVLGWAMFDFANTILSFAVITRYFNEWIIEDRGRPDWNVGLMGFIVGLVLVVVMPAAGAFSDRIGRRLPLLAGFSLLCVAATALLGVVSSTLTLLVVAGVAIFGYQLALSMYDPLLATVAPEAHRGRVSGLGVGLGYVGVLVGSQVLAAIVGEGDKQDAFLPTAVMFTVFALPIFLFVRERPPVRDADERSLGRAMHDALGQLARTASHIRTDHADTARFLIARFLYVDAIATVLAYMTVYMDRVGGFSEDDKNHLLGAAMIAAALGGIVAGRLVEALGPKRVLMSILLFGATTLALAAATGTPGLVWLLGPAVGITLGSVWTSDRVFMLRLSPPELRGEFFGVYNLVGKLSSGVGPLVLWSGTVWLLHERGEASLLGASRVALAVLATAIVAGFLVLRPLSDHARFVEPPWEDAA